MRLPIHRDGLPFIAAAAALNLGAVWLAGWPGWLLLPLTVWVVAFFRDPERKSRKGRG